MGLKAAQLVAANARSDERARCASIARLAARHAQNPVVKHAAEAIAEAIENDAI